MSLLIYLSTAILLSISGIHFYWAFGGKRGLKAAMPMEMYESWAKSESRVFSFVATIAVALGLLTASGMVLSFMEEYSFPFLGDYKYILSRALYVIFFTRAIGDFKAVGLFQNSDGSLFSKNDKAIYSPLVLFLSICIFVIVEFTPPGGWLVG